MAKKKGSWLVRMRCEVEKEIVCDDCTEEQAESDPFEHAVSERELEQVNYEVKAVEPNE